MTAVTTLGFLRFKARSTNVAVHLSRSVDAIDQEKWDERRSMPEKLLVESLASSEAHYRAILQAAVDAILTINELGIIQSINAATTRTFGYQPEELLGKNISMLMPSPYSDEHDEYLRRYLTTGVKRIIGIGREVVGKRKDGSLFPMELSVSEVGLPNMRLFTGIVRDISDRKLVEDALLAERNRVQQYLDIAAVIIISLDLSGKIQLLNRHATELFGITEESALGKTLTEILPHEADFLTGVANALETKTNHKWESALSSTQTFIWRSSPLMKRDGHVDGTLIAGTDVTELAHTQQSLQEAHDQLEKRVQVRTEELRKTNDDLRASLREKEVLLKEIHHRVKNNLQLISSLLSLQVRSRKGATVDQLVYEIQGRIHSIALLHEMLYQSGDLVHVNFGKYIETLAQTIVRYFGMNSRVDVNVTAEDIKLSLDGSIYCGLLLNELITNAMKHAFPAGRKGTLNIAAGRNGESEVVLSVADDGVGLPESFDIANATSLGLELVQSLTTKLHGELEITGEKGSAFQLRFTDQG